MTRLFRFAKRETRKNKKEHTASTSRVFEFFFCCCFPNAMQLFLCVCVCWCVCKRKKNVHAFTVRAVIRL